MEKLLNVQDVANLLGIKKITVYIWAEQHKLPCFKVGRLLKFLPSKLEAWLQKQEVLKKEPKLRGFETGTR